MTWKLALYDFVHARNQMETDYDWTLLRAKVSDGLFLNRIMQQQQRRRLQHAGRGLVPVRAETRLGIRRIETAGDEITVEVLLSRNLQSTVGGRPLMEERSEVELITMNNSRGNQWIITAVAESPYADRDTRYFAADGGADAPASGAASALPAPFLNSSRFAPVSPRSRPYDRKAVVQYAERYWNSYNPAYIHFDVDCSSYVSQCVLAGGHHMDYNGSRSKGWWYRGRNGAQELWSYSWAVANALQVYLGAKRTGGLRAEVVATAKELMPGDVISYSWDGDGRYGHSTIVTGSDPDGMPLVNAHTVNSRNRYWDYSDSYAWTERTQYRFFHIMEP
ncbi:MAG: hypothetical protein K0R57_2543 [Paenibacillaceae bacterium]|jgi:hypothetical protein|nr:hypothetical protein [Paenibacillaceae bacterium]